MKELGQDKWLAVQWGEHGGISRTLRDTGKWRQDF